MGLKITATKSVPSKFSNFEESNYQHCLKSKIEMSKTRSPIGPTKKKKALLKPQLLR